MVLYNDIEIQRQVHMQLSAKNLDIIKLKMRINKIYEEEDRLYFVK